MILALSNNTPSSLTTSKVAGDTITATFPVRYNHGNEANSTFKLLTNVHSASFTQEKTPSITLSLEDQASLVFYIST